MAHKERKKHTTKRDRREKKERKKKDKRKEKKHRAKDRDESEEEYSKPEVEISSGDYFTKSREFRVWLLRNKKRAFEDLSSEETHEMFEKFVGKWNMGSLEPMFYSSAIPQSLVDEACKTHHKWGFVSRITGRDAAFLEQQKAEAAASDAAAAAVAANGRAASAAGPEAGGCSGVSSTDAGAADAAEVGAAARTADRKRRRERDAALLDEYAPKETGREAAVDRRRTAADRLHGAGRDREDLQDGLSGQKGLDVMGGGGGKDEEEFRRRLARDQGARQRREAGQAERVREAERLEAEKRAAFLAQMGIVPGQGKITIKPRSDG
ncbi:unnamed protein product [Phaeothamnion confervicola]